MAEGHGRHHRIVLRQRVRRVIPRSSGMLRSGFHVSKMFPGLWLRGWEFTISKGAEERIWQRGQGSF